MAETETTTKPKTTKAKAAPAAAQTAPAPKLALADWAKNAGLSQAAIAMVRNNSERSDRKTAQEWLNLYQEIINKPAGISLEDHRRQTKR